MTLQGLQSIVEALPDPAVSYRTIPQIFGKSFNENFISDFLAYGLDPEASGLGTGPLEALLGAVGWDASEHDLGAATVEREHVFGDRKRIDLLIEVGDSLAIGIENKVLSAEGSNQTRRYARLMEHEFPGHERCLIFLTRSGEPASSSEFVPISYAELAAALRQVPVPWRDDIRRAVLWEDLLTHLEETIAMGASGSGQVLSQKTVLYLQHLDMIRDIGKSYERDAERLVQFAEASMMEGLDPLEWQSDFRPGRTWQKVFKPGWEEGRRGTHAEIWLSRELLRDREVPLMIDVEGSLAKPYLEAFDRVYPSLQDQYLEHGVVYRPPHRSHAIAWKTHPLPEDLESFGDTLKSAWADMAFLIDIVDSVMSDPDIVS